MAHVAARASGIVWGGLCAFHGIDDFRLYHAASLGSLM